MISSGSLFTRDYLEEAITSEAAWNDADLAEIGGRYLSRDLALAHCKTLASVHPDAEPEV